MKKISFSKRSNSDNCLVNMNAIPFQDEFEKKPMSTSKVYYKKNSLRDPPSLSIQTVLLILIGVFSGFFLATLLRKSLLDCTTSECCPTDGTQRSFYENQNENIKIYDKIEIDKNLVFIGVMTAQKYLDTRAKSVFTTWGQQIPGKMSFFSRSGSSSIYDIPLVSLPGVDDSYPPQKKSFMMLKFMHDNYLDKFEWFMRVDDDVYIKPDKLEMFLRSLNSSKAQFIGQAGLGNKDEFGLLSLDYDENFCMGGPGIVMSRETLRKVVPHISYCLKNLYSTHEDVEIGRCIRKFANVSCTWSYEMQHIFHHNSSGNNAYTNELLSKEVLRAISLHPVKKYEYQYRLHNFLNYRKIVDLRQRYLELKREVFKLRNDMANGSASTAKTTTTSKQEDNFEVESEFENLAFDKNENLSSHLVKNRFYLPPSLRTVENLSKREHRHDFDFFTRSLFASSYISPKRGLEGYWKKILNDNIRQIMDEINQNSIERGRLIDFKDILYGYMRHHPLYGIDFVLDILLVYRKYEGRKMTVPVRRHAYVRNTYSSLMFREDNLDSSIYFQLPEKYRSRTSTLDEADKSQFLSENKNLVKRLADFVIPDMVKNLFASPIKTSSDSEQTHANKSLSIDANLVSINFTQTNSFYVNKLVQAKRINFVLPLTGRWQIFTRFMKNYEDVCLKSRENAKLVVVLFQSEETKPILDEKSGVLMKQSDKIEQLFQQLNQKYSLVDQLKLVVKADKFSRSIGCEIGAALFAPRQLIFFVDVDIHFTSDFLFRARLNTIEFKQVYYPIVFSEYDPDEPVEAIKILDSAADSSAQSSRVRENHLDLNMDTGYWRQFGFGIVAVYNSDLRRVGGFDTSIVGWGKEDVDLYEKFVKSNITIFRSVDPGLIHVFHKIECDPSLAEEQMIMCLGSKSTSIASQRKLAQLVIEKRAYMKVSRVENFFNLSVLKKMNQEAKIK